MTQKEYDVLCDQFELDKELDRIDLEREWKVKRSLFFYVGSEKTVRKVRHQWEEAKQKDFDQEIAYRSSRREIEMFGPQGKKGAQGKIKEPEATPKKLSQRIADGVKAIVVALARPFYWLTRRLSAEEVRS